MVSAKSATQSNPAYATFRVPPRMTKHEIHEYLTKIYDLPIRKVNTMNYEGKRKRFQSTAGIAYYKYKDFKKAVVYFDDSFRDVGLGTRVPELEDEDDHDDDDNTIDVMDVEPTRAIAQGQSGQKQIGS
jgi:large subunit ribosomal protein L23